MGWPVERILEVAAVELAVAWYDAQRPGLGTEFLEALRASVPKVCAVGMSPTSALSCVVSSSILPVGKAVPRNCFSLSSDSGNSGSGFL
jgi:hypothetical protein